MVGSVAISVFLIGISINTFLTIVWGLKFSKFAVRSFVAINWIFSFALAFVGVGVNMRTPSDNEERFYARSIGLCWINHRYDLSFGLWLQNFWLILAIVITVVCYAWIFVTLLRNKQSSRHMPPKPRKHGSRELSGHHPAFLIYPAIYIITTAPITLVGFLSDSGNLKISTRYFFLVSGMSSLAGLLDAVLWSTTILMSSSKELKEVGLDTYQFIRTPSRVYGNIVWVEGAAQSQSDNDRSHGERPWWGFHRAMKSPLGPSSHCISNDDNTEGIYMDTITTVQVEHQKPTQSAGCSFSKVPDAHHRL